MCLSYSCLGCFCALLIVFLTFHFYSTLFFLSLHSTERQVQAVLAVLLICISFEIAGNPFYLVNDRFRILGRLELSTLFVQWATMWCGSMIYASQDSDSEGFVIFLTILVATMNIGMLIWLVVRLLMECVRESQEDATENATTSGSEGGKIKRIMSDLQMSVQRWRDARVSEETLQARIRQRTIEASNDINNMSCENPAVHIEMVESTGEVKVDLENNAENADTTAISILNATEPNTTMHTNRHWNRLKKSVKATNAFKASSGQKNRTKRLSKVMK